MKDAKNYIKNFRDFCGKVKAGNILAVESGDTEALKNLLAERNLLPGNLPKDLLDYLIGKPPKEYKELAMRKLEAKIKEERRRLRKAERGRDEKGALLKAGDMATWLARDLVFLKPPKEKDGKGKPNNEEYNELQSKLAYFGRERESLIKYFLELKLTGQQNNSFTHPFLCKITNPKIWGQCYGILDFYKQYTEHKIKWLLEVKHDVGINEETAQEKYDHFLEITPKTYKELVMAELDELLEQTHRLQKEKRTSNEDAVNFLVKDILFLKPPDAEGGKLGKFGKDKLKSSFTQFKNKQDIRLLDKKLRELSLKGKGVRYSHPFLFRVRPSFKDRNLNGFYSAYLNEQVNWLNGVKKEIKGLPEEKIREKYGYFLRIDTRSGKDKNYLKTPLFGKNQKGERIITGYEFAPVILPRGLFNAAIVKALKEKYLEIKEGESVVNCLKLLEKDIQSFYDRKRIYEREIIIPDLENSFETKNDEVPEVKREIKKIDGLESEVSEQLKAIKAEYEQLETQIETMPETTDEERSLKKQTEYRRNDLKDLRRYFINNEQKVRFRQSNDRALWLMLKSMVEEKKTKYESLTANFKNWRLYKVGFDRKEDNILDEEIEFELQLQGITIKDCFSIKRYGDFRRLLKDRRLWGEEVKKDKDGNIIQMTESGLLRYGEKGTVIERQILQDVLLKYDWARENFFQKVLEFEKALLASPSFKEKLIDEVEKGHIVHWKQLELVTDELGERAFHPFTMNQVAELRNKFFHNQMPYGDWILEAIEGKNEDKTIPERVIGLAVEVYDNLIVQLSCDKAVEP